MSEIKSPTVLAFERKLDPSDGLFSAGSWDDRDNGHAWPAVKLTTKSVRGTMSSRSLAKGQDPAKLDGAIQAPNLQTVDVAMLPPGKDTLYTRYTLKVLGGAGTPATCNNTDYRTRLLETVSQYTDKHGFGDLAKRYAQNIANGRFLWRNRLGAEQIEVRVNHLREGKVVSTWVFDALNVSLREFGVCSDLSLDQLAKVIEEGLSGKYFTLLEVVAYARVGDAQEVYPSQELILDRGDKKGQKSKTLYDVDGVTGLHSQKIGNALRTIDTWYDMTQEFGPIAVEPYGSVTSQGKAFRQPKDKIDFYNLLDNWVLKGKAPEVGHQHYVIATLIRGGVFGGKE